MQGLAKLLDAQIDAMYLADAIQAVNPHSHFDRFEVPLPLAHPRLR